MQPRITGPSPWIAAVLAVALVVAALPAAAERGGWVRPVDGTVLRAFEAPATPYGPGHRGVKLAAAPGASVRAAGPGTVTFAGAVAGSLHVVVAHDGGLRTSYSYLGSVAVVRGERVDGGTVVGTTGDSDEHGPAGSLHLGLRRGDTYLDPMTLFDVDLAEAVRLVPATPEEGAEPWPSATDAAHLLVEVAPPPEWVRAGVAARELSRRDGFPAALQSALGGVVDAAGSTIGWMGARLARAGSDARALGATAIDGIVERLARHVPAVRAAADLVQVGRRLLDWVEHRRSCDPAAPPADGTGGSRHSLMAVGGLDSALGPDGATFALDVDALGYDPDEVHHFSYAPDGDAYAPEHTRSDLRVAGERLGAQLRARQREDPGREVDLIAHSMGGVVVAWFLQEVYDPTDPAYPPLGTVVTLATPHRGAPLATALEALDDTRTGAALLGLARAADLPVPLGDATTQLSEHSALVRDLWARGPYEQLLVTSVGASDDVVVPADRVGVPGATVVTVTVAGLHDHDRITRDPAALRVVRAALERRDPPCVSFVDGMRGAVVPVAISRAQATLGEAGVQAGGLVDQRLWWLG